MYSDAQSRCARGALLFDAAMYPAGASRSAPRLLSCKTGQLIAEPIRVFPRLGDDRGKNSERLKWGPPATPRSLASAGRGLTRALTLTRSDTERCAASNCGDRFRDYAGHRQDEVCVWLGREARKACLMGRLTLLTTTRAECWPAPI